MNYRHFFLDPEVVIQNGDPTLGSLEMLEICKANGRFYMVTDDTRFNAGDLEQWVRAREIDTMSPALTGCEIVNNSELNNDSFVLGNSSLLRGLEIGSSRSAEDVLVGYDPGFDYNKLRTAADILEDEGYLYTISRRKTTRLTDRRPHQSALNAALSEFAEPTNLGFPSENALQAVKSRFDFIPETSLLLSDRLDLVEAGNRLAMDTGLLGVEGVESKLRDAEEIRKPDYVFSSLHSVRKKLLES